MSDTYKPAWTRQPHDRVVSIFARYCAPTALAAITDSTPQEAAETLLAVPGMAHPSKGAVCTRRWTRWLQEDLGLVYQDTTRPLEERQAEVAKRRAKGGWEDGISYRRQEWVDRWGWTQERRECAPTVTTRTVRYPTVAQWLRANPEASGILNVQGHTLAVRDGQVIGDTLTTKSMRCRVEGAWVEPR